MPGSCLDGVFKKKQGSEVCQASSACGIRFDPFSLMVRHNLGNALASLGHGTAVWVLKWTPTADNEGYSFDPSVIFF